MASVVGEVNQLGQTRPTVCGAQPFPSSAGIAVQVSELVQTDPICSVDRTDAVSAAEAQVS